MPQFAQFPVKESYLRECLILLVDSTESLEETLFEIEQLDLDEIDCFCVATFDIDVVQIIIDAAICFNEVFIGDRKGMAQHKKFAKVFEEFYDDVLVVENGTSLDALRRQFNEIFCERPYDAV